MSGAGLVGVGLVGVGVDAVDVNRFRAILQRRPGFAARYFTESEQADCTTTANEAESLAARFAAKEAVMKALGVGLGAFPFVDVEVRRVPGEGFNANAPSLVLHNGAATMAQARGAGTFHLSLTHTTEVAIAFVVAERAESCAPS
jgi:holo-[acyl-carrier protein] synthase